MICFFTELRCKEVIDLNTGCRIGRVDDIEFDSCTACIRSLIIFGRPKFFGLFGRGDDAVVKWDDIQMIGEDTILIKHCSSQRNCKSSCRGKDRQ